MCPFYALFFFFASAACLAEVDDPIPPDQTAQILAAYQVSSRGWSLDEVIIHDGRRDDFLVECWKQGVTASEKDILEAMLHIRKSGKLNTITTNTNRVRFSDELIAAEIAARNLADRFEVLSDQILIDPELRAEFSRVAKMILPEADDYVLRKALLRLRKSRHLRPELVNRVTDWKKDILELSVAEARNRLKDIPKRPGVYIFRDKTGFLYIGQSNNLRDRITKHLTESDRKSLAKYLVEHGDSDLTLELHVFLEGSPAESTVIREAYESELIRSRKPRLNLAP